MDMCGAVCQINNDHDRDRLGERAEGANCHCFRRASASRLPSVAFTEQTDDGRKEGRREEGSVADVGGGPWSLPPSFRHTLTPADMSKKKSARLRELTTVARGSQDAVGSRNLDFISPFLTHRF